MDWYNVCQIFIFQQNPVTFRKILLTYKTEVKDCEFGEFQDKLVRDSIVCDILNKDICELLLCDSDIILKKLIGKC